MDKPVSGGSLLVAAAVLLACIVGCGERTVGTAGHGLPATPQATPTPPQGPLPTGSPFPAATATASPAAGVTTSTVVFTCNVAITPNAVGDLDYTFSGLIFSDPNGGRVPDTGDQAGRICITGSTPCPIPRPPPSGPGLWVPDQTLPPGTASAAISVMLVTDGAQIAGIQSDVTFPPPAPIAAKANGKPDCTVNPDINKGATSFAFRPNGCSGTECTVVRALVLSTDNTDPIGEGDQPPGGYGASCQVGLECGSGNCVEGICCTTPACPAGEFCDIPGAQGQCQSPLETGRFCYRDAHCQSGSCVDNACCTVAACAVGESCRVFGHEGMCTALPTATVTPASTMTLPAGPTRTATPTPTLPPSLRVSSAAANQGDRVTISVSLRTSGALIAGAQDDLHLDSMALTVAVRDDGSPDCSVNPAIHKDGTVFAFLPYGCMGATCTGIRAVVFAFDNVDPIADGSVLYSCNVDIAPGASDGTYSVSLNDIRMSDPQGVLVPANGIAGEVFVGAVPTPAAPAIELSVSFANPDTSVSFSATLYTSGALVAGTQNDIAFDPHAPIAAKADGRPDCTANSDINKGATGFAFRPSGCSGATCTSIRALVLAVDNTEPIPDAVVLYTCRVAVAVDAAGSYPLTVSGLILSDPNGGRVPGAISIDGAIVVQSAATPVPDATPTPAVIGSPTPMPATTSTAPPTVTATPTVTGTLVPGQNTRTATATATPPPSLRVSSVAGKAGESVTIAVMLDTRGAMIAGSQNDLTFDSTHAPIAAQANGRPDCAVNPDIDKTATSFAFQPPGCSGTACTAVRALVLATDNTDPIPDGSVLYTCTVNVAADAPDGVYRVSIVTVVLSDPQGDALFGVGGSDGQVFVGATPTPTSTRTPRPTTTSTARPTGTSGPPPPSLHVSSVAGKVGESVPIAVTLYTRGVLVAGSQNDLQFDGTNIAVAARADGPPDCTVNPALHKDSSAFAFLPHGCTGMACTGVRALLFAVDNVDPIADGSVLYTCNVEIAAGAPDGVYRVSIRNVVLSDTQGNALLGIGGNDGQVFVGATPTPTLSWTPYHPPTPFPSHTPTPILPPAYLRVSSVSGEAGDRLQIAVTLQTDGIAIAGVQNDLYPYGVGIGIAARADGKPDCSVEPAIRKNGTTFGFLPGGIRAMVVALDNVDPIADGSVLYQCTVSVAAGAADGVYAVHIDNIRLSGPQGDVSARGSGIDGRVRVGEGAPAIALSIGSAIPGTQASVSATLLATGALVGGAQNDITFDPKARIAATSDGHPDCAVNGDINTGATSFAFLPSGCSGATCTSVRALVLPSGNVDPIADGSVLYTCKVAVADDAVGFYLLSVTGLILRDPTGLKVPGAIGIDGAVVVASATPVPEPTPTAVVTRVLPTPTASPTPTAPFTPTAASTPTPQPSPTAMATLTLPPLPTATATRTPTPTVEVLEGETVVASAGQQTQISVTLQTLGFQIAGTQNDLTFDSAHTPIAAKANGRPNCTVNANIDKNATSFAFRPTGCTGAACTSVRALVLATDNTDPIPDGSVLYTCKVNVAPDASGRYPMGITGVIAGTPDGASVPGASGVDGAIIVGSQ